MSACCTPGRGAPGGSTPAEHTSGDNVCDNVDGLLTIPSGRFLMGTDDPVAFAADGEGPVRRVTLSSFAISATCVSNREFARFVDATGYRTEAEVFGWSYVFVDLLGDTPASDVATGRVSNAPWWRGVRGATWRTPTGRNSDLDGLADHPVTHVSWNDAVAYCTWRGVRLPTEAQWERAARGGLEQARYPWGDQLHPDGVERMNIWSGDFPERDERPLPRTGTVPVTAYPPNGFGLHNTSGNVWEWTADHWSTRWHQETTRATRVDPRGPGDGPGRVLRGGSYLCHESYCNRYRVSARTFAPADSTLGHTGFRVVADLD